MKAHQILVSLGLLALLLVVTLVGGGIQDESQRVEIGTWVALAILIAGVVVWRFAGRSRRVAAEPAPQRRVVHGEEPASIPAHPPNMRPVLLLVAIGAPSCCSHGSA